MNYTTMAKELVAITKKGHYKDQLDLIAEKLQQHYNSLNAAKLPCKTLLPTDDEIEAIARQEILYNDTKRSWWIEGAKYMRDHFPDVRKMVSGQ